MLCSHNKVVTRSIRGSLGGTEKVKFTECVNKDRQHNKTEALNFHQWHVRMASEYAVTQCTTQILEDIIRSRNKEGTGDGDGEGIL